MALDDAERLAARVGVTATVNADRLEFCEGDVVIGSTMIDADPPKVSRRSVGLILAGRPLATTTKDN